MNSDIKFSTLGLSPEILETIDKKGFKFASEIQAKSIPVILEESHDIVGVAQTGTGKTAAFGLPLVQKIDSKQPGTKCIILTPTRELAIQVSTELDSFKGKKRIKLLPVYGGQPIGTQISALKRGVDIVVGTPGRVMDLIKRGILDLSQVDYFVLDEADEMLKMGFIDDIESILKGTSEHKRVFLYSATMPPKIKNLSKKYMKEQVVLEVKVKNVKRDNIEQSYFRIRRAEKVDAIKNIIALSEGFHGIIFCQTKAAVNELTDALKREKMDADCIHGDINQIGREKILKKFKARGINILVATDVAARGIDVDDLTHVINYSLPIEIDSYVHRIGRTGRAGKKGIAMTFIDGREEYKIQRLIRETKNDIKPGKLPAPEDVEKMKLKRLIDKLKDIVETKDTSIYATLSKNMVQAFGETKAISALLYALNGSGVPEKKKYAPDREERRGGGGYRGGGRGGRSGDRRGSGGGGGYRGGNRESRRGSSGGGGRRRPSNAGGGGSYREGGGRRR